MPFTIQLIAEILAKDTNRRFVADKAISLKFAPTIGLIICWSATFHEDGQEIEDDFEFRCDQVVWDIDADSFTCYFRSGETGADTFHTEEEARDHWESAGFTLSPKLDFGPAQQKEIP